MNIGADCSVGELPLKSFILAGEVHWQILRAQARSAVLLAISSAYLGCAEGCGMRLLADLSPGTDHLRSIA